MLNTIKNICDSWEDKILTLIRIWKELIPNLLDDLEGFKTLVEEAARELESEVEPEVLTELSQSHDKT